MDKISITINGETFEAKGDNLMDAFDKFFEKVFPDSSKEEVKKPTINIPKPYNTIEEYLGIGDLDVWKCTTDEKFKDLCDKLDKRATFAHDKLQGHIGPQILKKLDSISDYCEEVKNYLTNIHSGCRKVQAYITCINKLATTHHEDKN